MVSSFPQAGPCICEVAPRWLGSCHLYYRSASICAAQQPRPSSTASKGASLRRNTLQLEALRIRFCYDAEIVKAFRSSIPIQFPGKDGNFSRYRPTGSPMPVPVSPRATENNLMSLKRERISQRPVKHRLWNIGGILLVSNPDAAGNALYVFQNSERACGSGQEGGGGALSARWTSASALLVP